jgi:outer membrane receptor protein involved in Fe transport
LIATLYAAMAVRAADEAMASLESIVVVGSTPLAGSDIDRDRVPAATQVLDARDIGRTGIPGLTATILSNVPSATINDVEGNSFQPDILFRGFAASPVAGTPEGLAVYVNGARFNDAFGDTVNWDLIPPSAIKSLVIESSNPVFGLNALGGSINVQLKDGFSADGASVTALGGSYGRATSIVEVSRRLGDFAVYVTGDVTHDDGFRRTSASDLYRGYADLGWRGGPAEVHLDLTAANDKLGNPGATPDQALAADIANIFTAPNVVDNNYVAAHLHGTYELNATTSLQAMGYFGNFRQNVPNGITEEVAPCNDGTGLLCNSDGTVVTTTGGRSVRDFLDGGVYSGLSVQELQSHVYGLSLQATDQRPLGAPGGLSNHLVAGASFDSSDSTFSGVQEIGGFDPYSREFLGPGVIQDQPSEGVNPVQVRSTTRFLGLYFSETYPLAGAIDLSVSGRYNDARIKLQDELGGPVNGEHAYSRFNPSGGLSYRLAPWGQVYGRYSETNRVPTPQELSCASAANPCSLLNFFVGDPNLEQIVARTTEIGLRGNWADALGGQVGWNVDAYRTRNTNDIIYESTVDNPNLAFYTNAGKTLRQGIEANLRYDGQALHVRAGLAYTDASFRTPLDLNSGSNPAADANGQIHVAPGDKIPGIPKRRANIVVDYSVTQRWTVGGEAQAQGSAFRFGDEANLTAPVGGYMVVDLNAAYRPLDDVTVFMVVNNVFNKRYDTYGSFGPVGDVPWPNVPGGVTDPRTSSPGMPVAAYAGVRVTF